jgi:hypothetical protein
MGREEFNRQVAKKKRKREETKRSKHAKGFNLSSLFLFLATWR